MLASLYNFIFHSEKLDVHPDIFECQPGHQLPPKLNYIKQLINENKYKSIEYHLKNTKCNPTWLLDYTLVHGDIKMVEIIRNKTKYNDCVMDCCGVDKLKFILDNKLKIVPGFQWRLLEIGRFEEAKYLLSIYPNIYNGPVITTQGKYNNQIVDFLVDGNVEFDKQSLFDNLKEFCYEDAEYLMNKTKDFPYKNINLLYS